MTDDWKPPAPSALDDTPFPEALSARAIESGTDDDRLHGYAIVGDLAVHYRYSDVMYLGLVGELPDERASALFELALLALATPSVGEACSHLSVLTRLTGAPLASALAAGTVAAADQADHLVRSHADLVAWLAAPTTAPPQACCGEPDAWVARLRAATLRIDPGLQQLHAELTRDAARLALLHAAGLRTPDQMVASIVMAKLCGMSAEAIATGPRDLNAYPVRVPEFRYIEEPSE